MTDTKTAAKPDRAMQIRQQAKVNAKRDGKDWAAMSKDDRKVMMDAVRATMRSETEQKRAARVKA